MEYIELHTAAFFTCEKCGRDQFVYMVTPELSQEDRQELEEIHGVQPWQEGDWLMKPDEVQCSFCGARYKTTEPSY